MIALNTERPCRGPVFADPQSDLNTVSSRTSAVAVSNGFQLPLGNGVSTPANDGDGFYVATDFLWYNSGFHAYHLGEDWNGEAGGNTDLGQAVHAISNGTVVEKGFIDSFGHYLIIRHDLPQPITVNGITTSTVYSMYGHLEHASNVSVGDEVAIGDQIGTMGYTGEADGNAHLHLEIRLGYGPAYENLDGYAYSPPAGWIDPTDFINSHRDLSPGDDAAPVLTASSPSDNATAVAVGSNIILTFNEDVIAGSGDIVIHDAAGTVVRTIAITDASQVSFSGTTLTINPNNDLAADTTYYVNISAGAVTDNAGNDFAGIADATTLNFTTAISDLAGNTTAAARAVALNSSVSSFTDYVGPGDASDYYVFTTTGDTSFALAMNGMTADADVYLLDASGREITHSYNWGSINEAISIGILEAGTYFVQVRPYNSAATYYTLSLSATPLPPPEITVESSVTCVLGPGDNHLTLTGSLAIDGTGNALANRILGNSADNVLAGLGGADRLDGGDGRDTASYAVSAFGINVSLSTGLCSGGDAAGDTLVSIENLTGTNHDDTLEGDGGNNLLDGGLNSLAGDMLSYEHAAAMVRIDLGQVQAQNTRGAGIDTVIGFENVTGSMWSDKLFGTAGANTIIGGNGDDSMRGKAGADILTGGAGVDVFEFAAVKDSTSSKSDLITDFVHGVDAVCLSGIDADISIRGNQAFSFGGFSATALAHNVTWTEDTVAGTTIVMLEVNGDGVADATFTLTGLGLGLAAQDFIL